MVDLTGSNIAASNVQQSNKIVCSKCNKSFSRSDALDRHQRSSGCGNNTKWYSCEYCGKALSRPDSVKRHYKTCPALNMRTDPRVEATSSTSSQAILYSSDGPEWGAALDHPEDGSPIEDFDAITTAASSVIDLSTPADLEFQEGNEVDDPLLRCDRRNSSVSELNRRFSDISVSTTSTRSSMSITYPVLPTPFGGPVDRGNAAAVARYMRRATVGAINGELRRSLQVSLWKAAISGDIETARDIASGDLINPDVPDDRLNTPLMLAIQASKEKMVRLLLQFKRVNVFFQGVNGVTPLAMAKRYGHAGIVEQIMAAIESSKAAATVDQGSGEGR